MVSERLIAGGCNEEGCIVLILVLVEDGLRERHTHVRGEGNFIVLILVLVEDGLREIQPMCLGYK